MAYDEKLADRFRNALGATSDTSERKMMGGVCFMRHGNMIGGADRQKSGQGRFMFRVGKENQATALRRKGAKVMKMGDRTMGGFVFVNDDDCSAKQLNAWVDLALSFVDTLPPK